MVDEVKKKTECHYTHNFAKMHIGINVHGASSVCKIQCLPAYIGCLWLEMSHYYLRTGMRIACIVWRVKVIIVLIGMAPCPTSSGFYLILPNNITSIQQHIQAAWEVVTRH